MKAIELLFLIAALFLIGCEEKAELTQQITAQVYVDKLFLTEKYSDNTDTLRAKLDSMFLHYNTTEAVFDSSIKFYISDDKTLDGFFDAADNYVDSLKIKTKN